VGLPPTWRFWCSPGACGDEFGVLDDFNYTDGPIGSAWSGDTASFEVAGNTLTNVNGGYGQLLWSTSFGADQEIFTTLASIHPTAESISLILKEANRGDGWNWLEICYQPALGIVQVWTVHDWGTWIQHDADIPVTFQAGDQFGVRAQADGTVEIYRNGVLMDSVTVSNDWPSRADGGRVGVWLLDAGDTTLDDVGGGTLP
jgi:hypothetical protein